MAGYTDWPRLDSHLTLSVISILGIAQLPFLLWPHKAVTNVLAGATASSEAQAILQAYVVVSRNSELAAVELIVAYFFKICKGAADLSQQVSPSRKGLALIKSGIPRVFSLMN